MSKVHDVMIDYIGLKNFVIDIKKSADFESADLFLIL